MRVNDNSNDAVRDKASFKLDPLNSIYSVGSRMRLSRKRFIHELIYFIFKDVSYSRIFLYGRQRMIFDLKFC